MTTHAQLTRVEVTRRGNVGEWAGRGAEAKVSHVLEHTPGARSAHVVLSWRPERSVVDHALAEVEVDVNGRWVRAHAAEGTMHEAVDAMVERLSRRLAQLRERNRDRHRWTAVARDGEWRRGDEPRAASPYLPRPAEHRRVVRHKVHGGGPMTVDEAAYDMSLLDHDFFLFTEGATARAACLRRIPGDGCAVQRPEGVVGPAAAGATVIDAPAPPLTDLQARTRLEDGGGRWVFYTDPLTGGGRVLYLRYDGHYGLLLEGGDDDAA